MGRPPGERQPYAVEFYVAHDGAVPADDWLERCPTAVEVRISAIVDSVADAPPHRFAGGGMWEAMHGQMKGWYEVRVRHSRMLYRLFCLLDRDAQNRGPLLVVVTGMAKRVGSSFSDKEYAHVRAMGDRYWSMQPRPITDGRGE